MSTYAYCYHCGYELDNPSFPDAVLGQIECPTCGTEDAKDLDLFTRRSSLDEFVAEVTDLRQEVDRAGPVVTLRDLFAGQALTGLLADSSSSPQSADGWASDAYRMADAMMREREKAHD